MIITKHENYFFKLSYADKVLALNPVSKNSKLKKSKFGANIALSSIFHPDFNGYEQVEYKDKKPFIIKGAGEYEISDIFIKGFALSGKFDKAEEMISSYTVLLDGINVAFFGPISSGENFSNDAFEEFMQSDIFIIPIYGGETFSPKEAAKFLKQFLPKIVIPVGGSKEEIQEFADELGADFEEGEKLSVKSKDLPEEGKVLLYNLKIS